MAIKVPAGQSCHGVEIVDSGADAGFLLGKSFETLITRGKLLQELPYQGRHRGALFSGFHPCRQVGCFINGDRYFGSVL